MQVDLTLTSLAYVYFRVSRLSVSESNCLKTHLSAYVCLFVRVSACLLESVSLLLRLESGERPYSSAR